LAGKPGLTTTCYRRVFIIRCQRSYCQLGESWVASNFRRIFHSMDGAMHHASFSFKFQGQGMIIHNQWLIMPWVHLFAQGSMYEAI
jgi:hypothetical protein